MNNCNSDNKNRDNNNQNQQVTTIPQCTHSCAIATDHNSGEMVCTACGSVVGIDEELAMHSGPVIIEGKYSDSAPAPMLYNTGPPSTLTMHDGTSPSAMISLKDRDVYGVHLSAKAAEVMNRVRLWDNRIKYYGKNRTMVHVFTLLENIATKLLLPSHVHEKAAYIYRKALKKGLLHGRSLTHAVAAATYIATREVVMPVSMSDIVLTMRGGEKDREFLRCAFKMYRLFIMELDIKVPKLEPSKLITRIAAKLNLGEAITRAAVDNAKMISSTSDIAVGKSPLALAAATIYLTAKVHGKHINQDAVADAAGVTSVSARNILRVIHGEKLDKKFV